VRSAISALAAACTCLALVSAHAQSPQARSFKLADGDRIDYTLREFPPDAPPHAPDSKLAPTNAYDTARLLISDLALGKIEDAAMLSNAPKQRFKLLHDAYAGWTAEDFARTYRRYFLPQNRIVAEASIGPHHLVLWRLQDIDYLAGYVFVDIDGRTYLDDWLSPERSQLEQLLWAYRSGKLPLP
jgi:hypothetical protein